MDGGATLVVASMSHAAGNEPTIKESGRRLSSRNRTPNPQYADSVNPEELHLDREPADEPKMIFASPLAAHSEGSSMSSMSPSPAVHEKRGTKHQRSPSSSEQSGMPESTERKRHRPALEYGLEADDHKGVIKKGPVRKNTCRKVLGTERFSEWCRACQSKLKCRRVEDELWQQQQQQQQQQQAHLQHGAQDQLSAQASGLQSQPAGFSSTPSSGFVRSASNELFVSPQTTGDVGAGDSQEEGPSQMDYCEGEEHSDGEGGTTDEGMQRALSSGALLEGERGAGGRTSDMESLDPTDDHVVPGRRRLHICVPGCRHVCATSGCTELLTPAAARSRYVRCARCRKQGLPAEPTGRRPGRQAKTTKSMSSPTGTTPTQSQSPLASVLSASGPGGAATESPPPVVLIGDSISHTQGPALTTPAPTRAGITRPSGYSVAPVPMGSLGQDGLPFDSAPTRVSPFGAIPPAPPTFQLQPLGLQSQLAAGGFLPSLGFSTTTTSSTSSQPLTTTGPKAGKKPVPNLNFASAPDFTTLPNLGSSSASQAPAPNESQRRTSGGSEITDVLDSPRPSRLRAAELHKGSPRISRMRSSMSLLNEEDDFSQDYLDRDEPRFYISHCAPPAPMVSSKAEISAFVNMTEISRPTPTSSVLGRPTLSTLSSSSSSTHTRSSLSIQTNAAEVAALSAVSSSSSQSAGGVPSHASTSSLPAPAEAGLQAAVSATPGSSTSMSSTPLSVSAAATAASTPHSGPSHLPPPLSLNLSDSQSSLSLTPKHLQSPSHAARSLGPRESWLNSPSPSKLGRRYSISGSPLPQMSPGGLLAAQALTRLPRARLTSPLASFTFPPAEPMESDEDELESPLRRVRRPSTAEPRVTCRKCNTIYEDDEDDLIICDICRTAFHAGCEEPELDWMPTKAFCSTHCFEVYKQSPAGIRVFQDFTMLGTGHLRRIDASFSAQQLPSTAQKHFFGRLHREERQVVPSFPFVVGDCVGLRAQPTFDDPRTEWPAVIRHIFYHRSGAPLFFVTWLEPIEEDTYYYPQPSEHGELAAGAAASDFKEVELVPTIESTMDEVPDATDPGAMASSNSLSTFAAGEIKEEDMGGDSDEPLKRGQIRCPCGRVFSSGQALGGHRGKCKLPREKLRNLHHEPRERPSAAVATSTSSSGVALAAGGKMQPRSPTSSSSAPVRGTRSSKGVPVPIFPCHEFNLRDFKFGRNEKEAQVPACIVRHLGCSIDLPEDFLNVHLIHGRAKFNPAKFDDVVNDTELWGPLVFPESSPTNATLAFTREVPRKLTFANPGAKTDLPIGETVLPRARMRHPSKKYLDSST